LALYDWYIKCTCANVPNSRSFLQWSVRTTLSLDLYFILIDHLESPRWLLKRNNYQEALKALILLHDLPSPIIACGELYAIFRRLEAEEQIFKDELESRKVRQHADHVPDNIEMQNRRAQPYANSTAIQHQNAMDQSPSSQAPRYSLHSRQHSANITEYLEPGPSSRPADLDRNNHAESHHNASYARKSDIHSIPKAATSRDGPRLDVWSTNNNANPHENFLGSGSQQANREDGDKPKLETIKLWKRSVISGRSSVYDGKCLRL
jgi:hypothetical protein